MDKCLNCNRELTGPIIQKSSTDCPLQRCVKCKHVMAYLGNMCNKMVDFGNIELLSDAVHAVGETGGKDEN